MIDPLRSFTFDGSNIVKFHALGVCACTALECLDIGNSIIAATQSNQTFQLQAGQQIPDSITSLIFLTDLTVDVMTSSVQQPYDWVRALTTSTCLSFKPMLGASLTEPCRLTMLQRLQNFVVASWENAYAPVPSLALQLEWNLMQHLKEVRIVGQIIMCKAMLLHIGLVKSLKVLQLDRCTPADTVSMHNLASFAYWVAVLKPPPIFSMNCQIAKNTCTEAVYQLL